MIFPAGCTVLALDPGLRGCGVAVFVTGALDGSSRLVRAAYVKASEKDDEVLEACVRMARGVYGWFMGWRAVTEPNSAYRLLAEWPQVYRAGRAKVGADPNDLLALTGVVGATAALLGVQAATVNPHAWKGTLGDNETGEYLPEIMIMGEPGRPGRLRSEELGVIQFPAKSLRHNVIDAVGIGLHAVGRSLVDRRRVIAR